MRIELTLKLNEIDLEFISLIKILLKKNVEVVIKKEVIELEEYVNLPLEEVMQEFSNADYSSEFLTELEQGLKKSSVYSK
ncbi:hypothetical protein QUF50_10135 [Thiotrichales bacterium HSG1]|nr:hypothetical protein [Thiotrichales bacterium HSG1]